MVTNVCTSASQTGTQLYTLFILIRDFTSLDIVYSQFTHPLAHFRSMLNPFWI